MPSWQVPVVGKRIRVQPAARHGTELIDRNGSGGASTGCRSGVWQASGVM
jgi:hypothetical protein